MKYGNEMIFYKQLNSAVVSSAVLKVVHVIICGRIYIIISINRNYWCATGVMNIHLFMTIFRIIMSNDTTSLT